MHLRISVPKDIMKSKILKYVIIVILFAICGGYYYTKEILPKDSKVQEDVVYQIEGQTEDQAKDMTDSPKAEKQKIVVHICGAVVNPGVYELSEDARVYEAIRMAGGMTKDAAGDQLNQAQELEDGQQLYIPYISEETVIVKEKNTVEQGVNINTATKEELMTLPGIGESKAQAIIDYREQKGDFNTIQELTNISGIKNGVYEKIKELVRIR